MCAEQMILDLGPEYKIYTVNEIRDMLEKYSNVVSKAIITLYQYQTLLEKEYLSTNEHNGVGFNKFDGPVLSAFAEQILAGCPLTEHQMYAARRRIMKYAGQLTKIANAKQRREEI